MNFKQLLENYLDNQMDEKSFYEFLNELHYKLLVEHKFEQLEYLKWYPFVVQLLDVGLYQENILLKEVHEINRILNGISNYSYSLYIKLEKRDIIEKICKVWNNYKCNKIMLVEDAEDIEMMVQNRKHNFETISDIYITQILALLGGLPMAYEGDMTCNFLYVQDVEEKKISDDIERIISILKGSRIANILIVYNGGNVNYSCM